MHFTKVLNTALLLCLFLPVSVCGADTMRVGHPSLSHMPYAVQSPHTASELVAIGWRFYNNRKYQEAERFFNAALQAGPTGNSTFSVLIGLGYTELRLKNFMRALEYFQRAKAYASSNLTKDPHRADEGIFLAALSLGRHRMAHKLLEDHRHEPWTDRYLRPDMEIPLCIKAGDLQGAADLVKRYAGTSQISDNKNNREIYHSLLRFLAHHKVYTPIVCKEMLKADLGQGQVMSCIHGLRHEYPQEYPALMRMARDRHPRWFSKVKKENRPQKIVENTDQSSRLAGLAFDRKNYSKALEICSRAVARHGESHDLIAMAAWSSYHLGKWALAESWFRKGLRLKKNDSSMLSGLCWSLIKQGKCRECTELLKKQDVKGHRELAEPLVQSVVCQATELYQNKNYEQAARWFDYLFKLSPKTGQGLIEMAAWSYYRAERWKDAADTFSRLLETDTRQDWIDARARALAMQGRYPEVVSLYEKYHGNNCVSGDLSRFLKATGMDSRRICMATGCENYLSAGMGYRYRSGDSGQGRLDDWTFPALYARYRLSESVRMEARAAMRYVSNHRHNDTFSDAYLSLLYEPVPRIHLFAGAGLTGIRALTGTRPVWHAGVTADTHAGNFALTGYRSSVDDSLLSIAGMKAWHNKGTACSDTHRTSQCEYDEFGGVSRTGAYVSWAETLGAVDMNALLDFEQITGNRVRRNHRYLANFSAGTSLPVPAGLKDRIQPLWAGIYATWFRYERNLNYYTFGNGGYFSPRSFIASGPVINIRTVEGRCFIASFDASAGYINYIEDDGWQYPIDEGRERGYRYDGRSLNLLGFGIHGRGAYRMNRHLAIEARGGVDRSADFTQWGVSIALIIYPDRIAGLFFSGLPDQAPWLP